jgi:biopolymer transport protein ExbD
MAANLSGDDLVECHEINVTPFIDVMLVLLIIFMVAAPLATVDVPVDLPSSSAPPQKRPDAPLFVTVKGNGALLVGEAQASRADLAAVLDRQTGGDKGTRIFLRADRAVDYGTLMGIMDALREGEYLKVALVGLEEAKAR